MGVGTTVTNSCVYVCVCLCCSKNSVELELCNNMAIKKHVLIPFEERVSLSSRKLTCVT